MRREPVVDEKMLRDSRIHLAGIVNSAMDAIISVDANQRIVLFNAAAEKMFVCPAAEAVGQPVARFIPERFRDANRKHIDGFGRIGATARSMGALGTLNGLRANGEEFPIEASISQVAVNGTRLYTVILRDISERKGTEEMLRKLSSAIEQTADSVFITDRDGVIEYVNPAFEAVTGFTREMAIGRTPRLLKSGQHDQSFYEQLWQTILGGRIFRGMFVNQKQSGEQYFEEKTITPLKDEMGQICYFISTGRDITERAQAFQMLERRVEERTQETQQLYAQAEQRRRELEGLYRADEYLYRHLRLDQVLQALVDVVIDILHADKASVQVWDPQRERLVVRAARGYSQEMIDLMSTYQPGDGITGTVFLTGEPMAVEDARFAPPPAGRIADEEGIYSVLSVPLTIADQRFGVFAMDYCQPRAFTEDDRRLFLALAQRAAMAIQNARLYEQVEQAAVLQERQRMARDLHDSVSQSLYSLVLLAEAGRRFAGGGEPQHLEEVLTRLGETAQQALKEMRLMVYEMRPLALQKVGLLGALQQRLDAVEMRAGVAAQLVVEGHLNLPPIVEEELYRIAQEALNNALRHAGATRTTVRIYRDDAMMVEVAIIDNGVGFDSEQAGDRAGLGLSSMRQRAARIGGKLDIFSNRGAGTTVRIQVQLTEEES